MRYFTREIKLLATNVFDHGSPQTDLVYGFSNKTPFFVQGQLQCRLCIANLTTPRII